MPTFRVGKPRVKLTRNSDQTGNASNVVVPITWTTVAYEDPAIFDPLTPTLYTIPLTGLWLAVLEVNLATLGAPYYTSIQVNGVDRANVQQPAATAPVTVQVTLAEELQAGDAVRACVFRANPTGTWTLDDSLTWLTITRIGPERWTG